MGMPWQTGAKKRDSCGEVWSHLRRALCQLSKTSSAAAQTTRLPNSSTNGNSKTGNNGNNQRVWTFTLSQALCLLWSAFILCLKIPKREVTSSLQVFFFLHIRRYVQLDCVPNVHYVTQFICHDWGWVLKLMIYGSDMPLWINRGWVSNTAHRNDVAPTKGKVAKGESGQHAKESFMCDSFLCSLACRTLITQHRHLPHPLQSIIPPCPCWILTAFHHDPAPGNGDACTGTTMETESIATGTLKMGPRLLPESRGMNKI